MREYSVKDLASVLGVTVRAVNKWLTEGLRFNGPRSHAMIDIEEWARWRFGGNEAIDYQKERARLTKNQADHEEIRVLAKRGDLLDAPMVEAAWSNMVASFRRRMLVIPDRAAGYFDSKPLKKELQILINEALEELEKIDPSSLVGDIDSTEPGETTTELDG
jgi:phage terminase Nu1 subunit (DNA packaging protein)